MQVGQLETYDKEEEERRSLEEDELDLLPVYTKARGRTRVTNEEVDHLRALKTIDSALTKFKLSKNEIRVYLYLARFGAHKAQSVAEALSVHRTEAYKILRRLEAQGLISRIMERPMRFVAVPFENVLNNLIEERRQRIHQMEKKKAELLKIWKSLPEPENVSSTKETFQILEGKRHISVRLAELLEGCQKVIHVVVSDNNLIWLFNTPFLEDLDELAQERGIEVKLLTNFSPTSSYVLDQVNLGNGDFAYMKGHELPGFFISDNKKMILLMSSDQSNLYGMWTNYSSMVKSYVILFKLLWKKR